MQNETHTDHDARNIPPWYVDTLGAAGLSLQKNEDYAPPPGAARGMATLNGGGLPAAAPAFCMKGRSSHFLKSDFRLCGLMGKWAVG